MGRAQVDRAAVEVLGLSDGEAGDRIHVARAAKRFPVVLDMLGRGDLHLTAIRRLAPHLDEDNRSVIIARDSAQPSRSAALRQPLHGGRQPR